MNVLALFLVSSRLATLQADRVRINTRGSESIDDALPNLTLAKQKIILLTTFRRNGQGVGTPVHVAMDNGRAYFRTYDAAWKVKRLRHTPDVEVAPSTARGKPTGPAFRARVHEVHGEEAARASRALSRRYPFMHGILVPWAHRLKGYRTLHFSITPLVGEGWKVG